MPYLWIALGSAFGGMARYAFAVVFAARAGEAFPWGTLFVNVSGSFLIGFLTYLASPDGRPVLGTELRQLLLVGFCGGYTTFSSFSLQTLHLLHEGEPVRAGLNVLGSVGLCMAAVWLGYLLALSLRQLRLS